MSESTQAELRRRAADLFPGGVNSPVRAFKAVGATPLFIAGTSGATLVTWLIGFLSNHTGSLHSGMLVLVVSIAVLIVLQLLLSARGAGHPKSAPPAAAGG